MLLWAPLLVQARGLVPCGGYNSDGSREHICTVVDIFYLVARVTNWLIMIAGIYGTFRLIQVGFNLVISQGNEENIKKQKEAITEVVVGLAFVLFAYLLVNTAVNGILASRCKIDLRSPLTYLTLNPPDNNCVSAK